MIDVPPFTVVELMAPHQPRKGALIPAGTKGTTTRQQYPLIPTTSVELETFGIWNIPDKKLRAV